MDNVTTDCVLQVEGDQKADLWLEDEQDQRWRNQSPTPAQAAEIARLEQCLAALRMAIDELLLLAQQIRPHTIDAILAKSDVELGLDVLMGKLRSLR